MECVGCTACIDACDSIMDKIGKPRGLIRYASENSIANGEPLRYTTRMKLYTGVLGVVVILLSVLLATRADVDATIMRTPGMLFQERGTDSITNLYNIKMVNKTTDDIQLSVRLEEMPGKIEVIGKPTIHVIKEGQGSGSFFVILPKTSIKERKTKIRLALYEGDRKIATSSSSFLGPVAN